MSAGKFLKPLNAVAAGFSWLQSSFTRSAVVYGMPVAVGIELTNHCNLACPECSSGSGMMLRERGFMDPDLFGKIMHELAPYLLYTNLYFQGEPMLHPSFYSFLRKCQGIFSVVSTNGHFLDAENAEKIVRSGLNKLIISLDGTDQETYEIYRKNGSLEEVLKGIRNVSEARKKYSSGMKIEIQFLVSRFNEHQIPQVERLSAELKASLKLKSMQIINSGSIGAWLPSIRRFRRYREKEDGFIIKNSYPDRCARLWFNPVIIWDGKVVPCCFDKDANHIMGDLNDDSFREIWDGPRYRIFREMILSGRNSVDICRNCTSGIRGVVT
jgi:radical SAM protein with 4Fe4S-binding SPASM domain